MSDNFLFDLTGVPLDLSLKVAAVGHKAVEGWKVHEPNDAHKRPWLVFYWTDSSVKDLNRFPAAMDVLDLETFIKTWLKSADFGPEPDTDGSTAKGWRVFNEYWGHINHEWQAFMAVEPTWLEYGK